MPVKIKVPQSGKFKAPKLDNGPLTKMGNDMVAAQKLRWSKGIDANGNAARKLSVKYAIQKQAYQHKRAIRDNKMTGLLVQNFTLRKAIDNVIRAENTSREARAHATRSQQIVEMIGFAGSDQNLIFKEAQAEFGAYLTRAWVPIRG